MTENTRRTRAHVPLNRDEVRMRRIEAGLSVAQFAAKVGKTRAHMAQIESGVASPSEALLVTMAKALRCKPRDLLLADG